MFQYIFVVLFIFSLIVGALTLRPPDMASPSLLKKAMDKVGLASIDQSKRSIKGFSINVANGVSKIKERMKLLDERRQNIQDQNDAQKQILEDQGRDIKSLMEAAQQHARFNVDLMKMKQIAEVLEDQRRLMTANGREMVELNEKIKANMELAKEQAEVAGLRQDSGTRIIEDEVQALDQKMQTLAEKQSDMMRSLDSNREHLQSARLEMEQRLESGRDRLNTLMEQNSTKVADARQKSNEQRQMIKERVTDQSQRIRDQKIDQNIKAGK